MEKFGCADFVSNPGAEYTDLQVGCHKKGRQFARMRIEAAGHYKQQWPSSMHVSLCSMSEAAGHNKQQWPSSMQQAVQLSMSEAIGQCKQE